MPKRVFIIHGWEGSPNKDWLPWANSEFKNRGFEVTTPLMPDTDVPKIDKWVGKLKDLVGQPRYDDILIGHSIGCQAILRFLAGLPEDQKVGKVILVAPWTKLTNLENDEAWQIVDPWIKTPIDFPALKDKATSYTTLFSDNDSWVPIKENRKVFMDKLNPKIITLHNKGHFTEDEGITELNEILDLV